MPNPQQPELRRSGLGATVDDSAKVAVQSERAERTSGDTGPVPEANQPGHHPDHEQDEPDLDSFADRMGVQSDDPDPTDAAT
jgi:hypothetical protein